MDPPNGGSRLYVQAGREFCSRTGGQTDANPPPGTDSPKEGARSGLKLDFCRRFLNLTPDVSNPASDPISASPAGLALVVREGVPACVAAPPTGTCLLRRSSGAGESPPHGPAFSPGPCRWSGLGSTVRSWHDSCSLPQALRASCKRRSLGARPRIYRGRGKPRPWLFPERKRPSILFTTPPE